MTTTKEQVHRYVYIGTDRNGAEATPAPEAAPEIPKTVAEMAPIRPAKKQSKSLSSLFKIDWSKHGFGPKVSPPGYIHYIHED